MAVRERNVRITHPNFPDVVSYVSEDAYEGRSRGLGWVRDDEDDDGEAADAEREALLAQAASLGLRVHPKAKNDTIRRLIEKALEGDA